MLLQQAKQDVIANNLANASTPGFKKEQVVCTAFPGMLINRLGEVKVVTGKAEPLRPVAIGRLGTGAAIEAISTDYSAGMMQKNGQPFGPGYRWRRVFLWFKLLKGSGIREMVASGSATKESLQPGRVTRY